jgi:hypothetical protein
VITFTPADLQTALADLEKVTPASIAEVIKNPGDLANDLTVVVDALKILAICFPELTVVVTLLSALETFLPLIETGVEFTDEVFGLHFPTGDPNPEIDAQLSTGR